MNYGGNGEDHLKYLSIQVIVEKATVLSFKNI